jgi:putative transposase
MRVSLLARYYCTKKTRPSAHPRFGSVIERLFGTTNTAFIHSLRGNTQATVSPRTLTTAVDPKRLAVWPLPDLYHCLCEWAYTVYDHQVHEALGQSPHDACLLGLERYGVRAHRRVLYDEDFLRATNPSPRKPMARVVPGKGVKIHDLYYWHDALRHPEVERTHIPSPRQGILYSGGELTRPYSGNIPWTSAQSRTAPRQEPSMRESQRV